MNSNKFATESSNIDITESSNAVISSSLSKNIEPLPEIIDITEKIKYSDSRLFRNKLTKTDKEIKYIYFGQECIYNKANAELQKEKESFIIKSILDNRDNIENINNSLEIERNRNFDWKLNEINKVNELKDQVIFLGNQNIILSIMILLELIVTILILL